MHRKEPCTAQKEPCISKKEPCISPKEPCTIGKEQCVPVLYKRALYTLKRALYITIRTLFIKKKQYRLHMLQSAQFFPHFIYHFCFPFNLIIHSKEPCISQNEPCLSKKKKVHAVARSVFPSLHISFMFSLLSYHT